jgi:hypothetical protein
LDVETRGLFVQRAAREFAVHTANFAKPDQTQKIMRYSQRTCLGVLQGRSLARSARATISKLIFSTLAMLALVVEGQGLPDTRVGTFTQALYDEAKKDGWIVISMKNDWKRNFRI